MASEADEAAEVIEAKKADIGKFILYVSHIPIMDF